MRKILFLFLFLFLLTGCEGTDGVYIPKNDYSSFNDTEIESYSQIETIEEKTYIIYYYDSTKEDSDIIYDDFFPLYKDFSAYNIYTLDISKMEDQSQFINYKEPSVYIIQDGEILEYYEGQEDIQTFVDYYDRFDYSLFEDVRIKDISQSLLLSEDTYIEYYYSPTCSHCSAIKETLLTFFFNHQKDLEFYLVDIYQINIADIKIESFEEHLHYILSLIIR